MCKKFKKALALVLSLTLVVGAFCMVPTSNAKETRIDTANWMRQLLAVNNNIKLNEITMPCAHNAGSCNIQCNTKAIKKALGELETDSIFPTKTVLQQLVNLPFNQQLIKTLQRTGAKCQDLSITEQLKAGVRCCDLRYKYNKDKDQYFVYHGRSDGLKGVFANSACYNSRGDVNVDNSPQLSLADVFATMAKYLKYHNSEAIFIFLSNERGTYADGDPGAKEVFNEVIKKLKAKGIEIDSLDTVNGSDNLSTYKNKIVYLDKTPDSIVPDQATADKWKAEASKSSGIFGDNFAVKYYTQEFKYGLNTISNESRTAPNSIFKSELNLALRIYKLSDKYEECSLLRPILTPRAQAKKMNKLIKDFIPTLPKGKHYGIIKFDFVTKKLCKNIINLNQFERRKFAPVSIVSRVYSTSLPWDLGYDTKDWMQDLINDKSDIKLCDVTIPGTHNSATTYIYLKRELNAIKSSVKYMFSDGSTPQDWILNNLATKIQNPGGRCQKLSITKQLEAGVRYFDLRYTLDENGNYVIYHGQPNELADLFKNAICYKSDDSNEQLSVTDVFVAMKQYLDKYPGETIFVTLQDENGTDDDEVNADAKDVFTEECEMVKNMQIDKDEFYTSEVNMNDKLSNYQGKIVYLNGKTRGVDCKSQLATWQAEATSDGMTLMEGENPIPFYQWPSEYREKQVMYSLSTIGKLTEEEKIASGKMFKTSLNLGLKLYGIYDKCGECDKLRVAKTPYSQESDMNMIIKDLYNRIHKDDGDNKPLTRGAGYGIIQVDFVDQNMCRNIINLNKI